MIKQYVIVDIGFIFVTAMTMHVEGLFFGGVFVVAYYLLFALFTLHKVGVSPTKKKLVAILLWFFILPIRKLNTKYAGNLQ